MKIGIDLRFLGNDVYSRFVSQLICFLIKTSKDSDFIIYTNSNLDKFKGKNIIIKQVNIKNGSFEEQVKFRKILKKDANNLVLFFNHYKPIFYKGQYITFVGSLKDIFYMNFKSHFTKYKFLFLMNKNLRYSYKLICFDGNTRDELIEKFDIPERKIEIICGFFPDYIENNIDNESNIDLNISIKTKYGITNKFFIYSGGDGIEKNYDKLISVFAKLRDEGENINIVFLGHNISTNLNLRLLILEHKMQKNIHFLGAISLKDKEYLYKESLGTIFPSLYEPFPFKLGEPLMFGSLIFASDIKSIKDIFGKKIIYFSPISVNSIFDTLMNFLKTVKKYKQIDYKDMLEQYNIIYTNSQLIEIIK